MEPSPDGCSSGGESTSSEPICSRTNPLSPLPSHASSSYDHHSNNNHHQINLASPHQHHVSPRYVSVLTSSSIDGSSYTPGSISYAQSIGDNLLHADIKYESPLHSFHHRENGEIFKNLESLGENSTQRLTVGKATLSLTQVECICEAMLQRDDIKKLDDFLKSTPQRLNIGSEAVFRARIHVLFKRQNFTEMYKLMESYNYSPKYHAELQDLWYKAHYKEQENVRGRNLGAVDKYRIRNKFQLPKTIWDGEKTTYCFKDRAREALKDCYLRCRYPTPNEKKALSEITGLTSIQVSNWFKNKRQRDRTPQSRDGELGNGTVPLGPRSGSQSYGRGGDDSSEDMKPVASFRVNPSKRTKSTKTFLGDGRLNMMDLGRPISLTRKDSDGNNSSVYSSLTITPTRTANHIPGNGFPPHLPEIHGHTPHPANGNNVSVIQSLAGAHCQFYPQNSSYDTLIHSPPNHYTSHGNSPQILSYG